MNSYEPPSSLFEKFLTDDILQFLCNESVRYIQIKETITIAILLISGYVDLPGRPMFWE